MYCPPLLISFVSTRIHRVLIAILILAYFGLMSSKLIVSNLIETAFHPVLLTFPDGSIICFHILDESRIKRKTKFANSPQLCYIAPILQQSYTEASAIVMEIQPIAYIHTNFQSKFGIPRQSGLADTHAEIHFEPEYASPEAVRGIEEYSYLWLIWGFSENIDKGWHPTVRPPRLGGNTRVGVFATRSPFRPNGLGLSSVQLDHVEIRDGIGPVLHVIGADLMDGTPIYDVKPYLPYADSHEGAAGFTDHIDRKLLEVNLPDKYKNQLSAELAEELMEILAQDPRPSYQNSADRIYGITFANKNVKFQVADGTLTVIDLQ